MRNEIKSQCDAEKNMGHESAGRKTSQGFTPEPWLLKGPMMEDEHECGHKHCDEHPKRMTGYDIWSEGEDGTQRLWLASIHGEHVDIPREQAEANARLFYAAPVLYKALRDLGEHAAALEMMLNKESEGEQLAAARAALALVAEPVNKSAQRPISNRGTHGQASRTRSG